MSLHDVLPGATPTSLDLPHGLDYETWRRNPTVRRHS